MRHSPKPGSDATCAALRRGCVGGAVRRAWTAALHGPRCCTQRPKAGDRLDAGRGASGDAVQEGAPGGAVTRVAPCTGMVTCFTVRESRSRVAADAISLARSCGHRVSGCTMNKATRPPSGSANGTGTLLPAPSRTDRKEGPRTARERLTRRPALPRATQGVGCMPTRGRFGSVAGAEGPMPFCQILLGYPRESRRDRSWKAARGDLMPL